MDSAKLNKEKFENIILYTLKKCSGLPHFGKTLLYKILYFSDFDFYEKYETYLTGESYRKIKNGPAPSHFDRVIKDMEKKGKVISCKIPFHTHDVMKFIPKVEPDLTLLTASEISVIDNVIERLSHMNATQISEYSHRDIPFKATEDKEIIDYELVFYRDPMFSVREYDED